MNSIVSSINSLSISLLIYKEQNHLKDNLMLCPFFVFHFTNQYLCAKISVLLWVVLPLWLFHILEMLFYERLYIYKEERK